MVTESMSSQSLYTALAVDAPACAPVGETITTKAKETIDNDVEMFFIEDLVESG
jgi:hypothetical protein